MSCTGVRMRDTCRRTATGELSDDVLPVKATVPAGSARSLDRSVCRWVSEGFRPISSRAWTQPHTQIDTQLTWCKHTLTNSRWPMRREYRLMNWFSWHCCVVMKYTNTFCVLFGFGNKKVFPRFPWSWMMFVAFPSACREIITSCCRTEDSIVSVQIYVFGFFLASWLVHPADSAVSTSAWSVQRCDSQTLTCSNLSILRRQLSLRELFLWGGWLLGDSGSRGTHTVTAKTQNNYKQQMLMKHTHRKQGENDTKHVTVHKDTKENSKTE